jgi:hypothetical protein
MIDPFDDKEIPDPAVLTLVPGPPDPKDRPVPILHPQSQGTKAIQEPQVRRLFRRTRLLRQLQDHLGTEITYPLVVDRFGDTICRLPPLHYPMQDWMSPYLLLNPKPDGTIIG